MSKIKVPPMRSPHKELEKKIAEALKQKNLVAFSPSYPDMLVYDEKTKCFCFVEVKTRYKYPNYFQQQTWERFKELGLPVVIFYPENRISKILRAMKKCPSEEFTRGFAVGYALEMRRKAKEEQNKKCNAK